MPHPISKTPDDGKLSHFQRLLSTFSDPEPDLWTKLERLFADETGAFDLDYAFFSRIDTEAETQSFEVVHGSPEGLVANSSIPLSVTYCRKTIENPEGTMVVSDAAAEGWEDDPAYERFGFDSYVGTTVTVDDELYGTLCYLGKTPRDEPLTDTEAALVEMQGQWVTYELSRWSGPPTHDTVDETLDGLEPSTSPRIDAMMDALGKAPRRRLLLRLLNSPMEDGIDVHEAVTKAAQIPLHHVHLPKLEGFGYVDWDHEANTVYRGSNFTEIEPMLRLLNEYSDDESP